MELIQESSNMRYFRFDCGDGRWLWPRWNAEEIPAARLKLFKPLPAVMESAKTIR
jgi:transposase